MRRTSKASSAGSTQRQANGLGRTLRGAFATRRASLEAKGSSAPSARRLIAALSALALLLALAPASASAVPTRAPLGFSPITGAGTGVTLHLPSGIAVDETSGNVFLDDGTGEGNVVDIFGAEGGVPAGVASPYQIGGFAFASEPSGAAVDNSATSPSKGALYVVDVQHNTVKKFTRNGGTELYEAAGELTPSSGPLLVEPLGAAVDSKGNVFVADYGSSSVVEFGPTGTQLARIDTSATVGHPSGVALDEAGDLFVQSYDNGSAYKYPANGSGQVEAGVFTQVVASGATGLAVDSGANELFVALGGHVTQYDAATLAQQLEFGAGALGQTSRIAVNSASERIYVSDLGKASVAVFGAETKIPGVTVGATTGITGTRATLNASVNPDGLTVTECKFEYGTTTSYGNAKPCEGAIPADSSDHPVSAALTNLTPGSTYHFRIVVDSASGSNQSSDQTFQTFETPQVVFTEAATAVTGAGATLNGSVNPDGLTVTECRFEYGTSTSYGSTAPCAESAGEIGTGTSPAPVHVDLSGLNGGTTYHFRLLASSSGGTAHGADLSFITGGPAIAAQSVESVGVSDATVSAKINPKGEPTTYRVEYGTTASYGQSTAESAPIGFPGDESAHPVSVHIGGLSPGTAYHFRFVATSAGGIDRAPDATLTTFSAPPAFAPCPNDEYRGGPGSSLPDCRAYEQATPEDKHGANIQGRVGAIQTAPDGSRVTFYLNGGLPVSGGSSATTAFLASRGAAAWSFDGLIPPTEPGDEATLRGWSEDLSTSVGTTPVPGGALGLYLHDTDTTAYELVLSGLNSLGIAGFAADTSHLLFQAFPGSLPVSAPGVRAAYDLDHGNLTLAGRIPSSPAVSCDDELGPACVPAPEGSFPGPYLWVANAPFESGLDIYYLQNVISRDGSRVFFTASGSGQLYVREDGTRTTWVSASLRATPDPNGERPAAFLAATPDGSKTFFLSCEKLTDDSTAVSNGESTCVGAGRGQDLYSYEAGSGQLTDLSVDSSPGDPLGADVQGFLGASEDGSHVYFVANGVLAPGASQGDCRWTNSGATGTCNLYVSHDGSVSYLTTLDGSSDFQDWSPGAGAFYEGKDSRVSADGHVVLFRSRLSLTGYPNAGRGELFRYDLPEERLTCVSCLPTGLAPSGDAALGPHNTSLQGGVPMQFLNRNLSADGSRVFFETPDALLPTDTNGVADVYEWEAKGSGSCGSEAQDGGCLYLISSGTSPDPSRFADASRDGDHVFILTGQRLVPSDGDELVDLYDAGVGAGLAAQHTSTPPTCSTTACQANPPPPPDPGLASATFSGPGNVHRPPAARRCPKGKRKVRHAGKARCQKQSHKRHVKRGGSK